MLADLLRVLRGERIEQVVQICVTHIVDTQLGRRCQHNEIVVLVAARVYLVRWSQQIDIHKEPPAHVTAGRIAKIPVHLEQGARTQARGIERAPAPCAAAAPFAITRRCPLRGETRYQPVKAFERFHVGRNLGPIKARRERRRLA